jgi:hypothetical protein
LAELDGRTALCDALAECLISVPELRSADSPEDERWRQELTRIADDASHSAVRVIAFAAAGGSEATAAAVLATMSPKLAYIVAGRVVEKRAFGVEIARAVAVALEGFDGRDKDREDLESIAWNCRQAMGSSRPELLLGSRLSSPWRMGESLVVFYHRILTRVPPSRWSNDEDEMGAMVISRDPGVPPECVPLPMAFPIRSNGANRAKRKLTAECVVDGEIFVTVECPFSDERGWGTENYLWSFRPPDGWRSWARGAEGLVAATAGAEAQSVCYGELMVWRQAGVLHHAIDGTRYHLDDWTVTDEVAQASAARREARKSYDEQLRSRKKATWDKLEIARPEGAPELDTVWVGRWGKRSVVLANCRQGYHPVLALVVVDG